MKAALGSRAWHLGHQLRRLTDCISQDPRALHLLPPTPRRQDRLQLQDTFLPDGLFIHLLAQIKTHLESEKHPFLFPYTPVPLLLFIRSSRVGRGSRVCDPLWVWRTEALHTLCGAQGSRRWETRTAKVSDSIQILALLPKNDVLWEPPLSLKGLVSSTTI